MRELTLTVLGLTACLAAGGATAAGVSSNLRQWQTATGRPPSKAEFAALVAACEDRAKHSDNAESIDNCLAGFGLHRFQ
jgi:hypothetical protein